MQTPWKQTTAVEEWSVVTHAGTFTRRWGVSSLAGERPPGSGPLQVKVKTHLQSDRTCVIPRVTHTHLPGKTPQTVCEVYKQKV